MAAITIKTNNVPRDTYYIWQLTDKEQKQIKEKFDYYTEEELEEQRFFEYEGRWHSLIIGSIVRPISDGEDSKGILKWTKLRGKVIDLWEDCGELRVQVRWFRKSPYPTVVPAYWLTLAD